MVARFKKKPNPTHPFLSSNPFGSQAHIDGKLFEMSFGMGLSPDAESPFISRSEVYSISFSSARQPFMLLPEIATEI